MACSFGLKVMYCMSGWEGSAADTAVYNAARVHDFSIPKGKYYLADAGYVLSDELLLPYSGVRYHLREWEVGNRR